MNGFRLEFEQFAGALPRKTARKIETALVDCLPAWRIQKAVVLEMKAKEWSGASDRAALFPCTGN